MLIGKNTNIMEKHKSSLSRANQASNQQEKAATCVKLAAFFHLVPAWLLNP
jgi:hypothetical protein